MIRTLPFILIIISSPLFAYVDDKTVKNEPKQTSSQIQADIERLRIKIEAADAKVEILQQAGRLKEAEEARNLHTDLKLSLIELLEKQFLAELNEKEDASKKKDIPSKMTTKSVKENNDTKIGAARIDKDSLDFRTTFFEIPSNGRSFLFVIDHSGSMAFNNSLNHAKIELLASLEKLPADAYFGVILYNQNIKQFSIDGSFKLAKANQFNKQQLQKDLEVINPEGGTDHIEALRIALGMKPDIIYFLSDADLMTYSDVSHILSTKPQSKIHALHLSPGPDINGPTPLKKLASSTGGIYKHLDSNTFRAD